MKKCGDIINLCGIVIVLILMYYSLLVCYSLTLELADTFMITHKSTCPLSYPYKTLIFLDV